MYFEYNLPRVMPVHMDISLLSHYGAFVPKIISRMDKLNIALDITGLDGASFSRCAKFMFDNFFEKFEKCTPEALAEFVMIIYDGTVAEPRLDWPNATVVVDTAFVRTEEWEFIRMLGIGGSDAAVVYGISPYTTKRELYHNKCGTPSAMSLKPRTAVFARGHILEDKVVTAFCKKTGAKQIPETRMFCSKKHPHSTANIDQFIELDGKIYIFEAKTSIAENVFAWTNDQVPAYYLTQMRQYPAVMDDDRIAGTYIGCLFTKDFILSDVYMGSTFEESRLLSRLVERDPDAEDELLTLETDFWEMYLYPNILPPPDGDPDRDIEAFRKYSGPADPKAGTISLPLSTFKKNIEQYLTLGKERSQLEKQVESIKARQKDYSLPLIESLGIATVGEIPIDSMTYYEVKYSPRQRVETDLSKLELAFPEAYAACVTCNPESSRVFYLREKKNKLI